MTDVKGAVEAAVAYLTAFPNLLQLASPRLEETETDPDTGDWLITISSIDDPNALASVLADNPRRIYRQVRVDKNTGQVLSMKRRTFQDA
jgi:hypothetical protein